MTYLITTQAPTAIEEMVAVRLPALAEQTAPLSRSNSQTTLSIMTLTMMTGQSPMRQVRQILAEIEKKKSALAEAQVSHAELQVEEFLGDDIVAVAKTRLNMYRTQHLETTVKNAIKDIATLIYTYDNLVAKHGIEDWTEADFERAEAKHHIRRGFELLYRNVVELGRGKESSIEYLQQFGVHIQVALKEVAGYIGSIEQLIQEGGRPDATSIEDFLDEMATKYEGCAEVATERMFGTTTAVYPALMNESETPNAH
jgi:hypothetical protein